MYYDWYPVIAGCLVGGELIFEMKPEHILQLPRISAVPLQYTAIINLDGVANLG